MRTRDTLFGGTVSSTYGISSISWWLARIVFLQQRILDERSSSLFDLLHVYMGETLQCFDTLEKVTIYFGSSLCEGEASTIISMVHLEAGIMEYTYGRADSCRWVIMGKLFCLINLFVVTLVLARKKKAEESVVILIFILFNVETRFGF